MLFVEAGCCFNKEREKMEYATAEVRSSCSIFLWLSFENSSLARARGGNIFLCSGNEADVLRYCTLYIWG